MSENTSDRTLAGKASIAGIGATDFSKDSGRSELRLAAEAVTSALDDAGLAPSDVDGLVSFTMDTNTEIAVARAAGIGELMLQRDVLVFARMDLGHHLVPEHA